MVDERRQFRLLYRGFLLRFLDLELLSSQGAMHNLLSQVAAVLAAVSFVLALFHVDQYVFTGERLTRAQLTTAAWGSQEFLISTTMVVIGMFTILMWDSLFPDRRDSLVLGPLPVRPRTMFAAKVAAIGAALGLTLGAVNVFTGLSYPLLVPHDGVLGAVRGFAAYWVTMIAASLFLFAALLGVQGVALHALSHGRFLRVSGVLQMAAFFAIVSVYFLMPPLATPRGLAAPENQRLLAWLPPFWFLGLYQVLSGNALPVFAWLARRAATATLLAAAVASVTYALAYGRHLRRVVEQSGIVPADSKRKSNVVARGAARLLFRQPLERALFLFVSRTLARSRQHRMLLAIYGGFGLAVALVYLREFLYRRAIWTRPDTPLLAASVVLLAFGLVGIRFCFSLPVELRANWVFRLTERKGLAVYRRALRKTLLVLVAVPVWLGSAALFPMLWPLRAALTHLLLMGVFAVLAVEFALKGFRKIPFTCSYLPGQANLKVTLGAYAILILFLADLGVRIELAALGSWKGCVVVLGMMAAGIVAVRRRSAKAVMPPFHRLMFEEKAKAEVSPLDLRGDAESWVDQGVLAGSGK